MSGAVGGERLRFSQWSLRFQEERRWRCMVVMAAQEMHGFDATHLCTKNRKWSIFCCVYFTTGRKKERKKFPITKDKILYDSTHIGPERRQILKNQGYTVLARAGEEGGQRY